MTLSDKSVTYEQVLGIHYLEDDVKAFIKELKDDKFIMTILKNCIEIDEEEKIKFIDKESFRRMINQEAGDKLI